MQTYICLISQSKSNCVESIIQKHVIKLMYAILRVFWKNCCGSHKNGYKLRGMHNK